MTYIPGLPLPGTWREPVPLPEVACRNPKCRVVGQVVAQQWDSMDGAFNDTRYTCGACNKVWWYESIDS